MPYSTQSILIIEDDSRISRLIRDSLHQALPGARIEIAGSAAKAKTICQKFPPKLIIWDGSPNERGTTQEYVQCVPDNLWQKVVAISVDADLQTLAREKKAAEVLPKVLDHIHPWAESLVRVVKKLLGTAKKK